MSVFDDFERGGQWAVPGFGGMVPGRLVHGKNGTEMHAMYVPENEAGLRSVLSDLADIPVHTLPRM